MGKLLESISNPDDLKALGAQQLPELAEEIRQYLIQSVARTGGHLGPNLGVVELTIGLHRVFDSPRDTIIFDTGHQSYVHKLLTGRQDFSALRERGGISGYPSRAESAHDVVENSHASTALSWGDGVARAKALKGDTRSHVVAVIGDGAMTGGMAWEAMNNIAVSPDKHLVIVVNDNGRSYAPTIGGLAHHLDALRTSAEYERTLGRIKSALLSQGAAGRKAFGALHGLKRGLKDLVVPEVIFEDLGIKYTGPVDGHDLQALEAALQLAHDYEDPVIVHVKTEKGRGYSPAEEDVADRFHAVGKIHPETGLPVVPSRFGWTKVFAEEILAIAHENDSIVGVTAAMKAPVGLNLLSEAYPQRVIDVGIAEQHALTMAAGMAFAGMHPVVALYATFLNRAYDQLLMDVAMHHAPVTVVLDRAGITGADGASHNGMWDIAMAAMIPGMRLAAPRDEATLRRQLRQAVVIDDGPSMLRYRKGSMPAPIEAIETLEGMDWLYRSSKQGADKRVLLVAAGAMAEPTLAAAAQLEALGYAPDVIDPCWLLPINPALVQLTRDYDLVVSAEDGLVDGGFGSALRDQMEVAQLYTPMSRIGIAKKFLETATRAQLMADMGMDSEGIVARVQAFFAQ